MIPIKSGVGSRRVPESRNLLVPGGLRIHSARPDPRTEAADRAPVHRERNDLCVIALGLLAGSTRLGRRRISPACNRMCPRSARIGNVLTRYGARRGIIIADVQYRPPHVLPLAHGLSAARRLGLCALA